MTDARLPGHFLNLTRFDELSDAAVRVFVSSLMWSNEQATDGVIPTRYLRLLHPDGLRPDAYAEIVAAGFWRETPDGFDMPEWSTKLGQNTAEQVEAYRAAGRVRTQRYRDRLARERDRVAQKAAEPATVTHDVTRRVTGDVGGGIGGGGGERESADTAPPVWHVVPIPSAAPAPFESELI